MEGISNAVELQICEVRACDRTEATATVRNLRGSVFRSARFRRVSDSPDPIDLELTGIIWYGRAVDEILAGHTALVTLRGAAAPILRSGNLSDGWQSIEGCNA
ncbi:hypothetical protein AB0J72_26225 [Dactylosporangium sp. NPDC049742]|uniref:hypothetical protein n=1 Tax=Dactylosporangium sp. NPDC049742 TaxID=3154737 RepID=UPI003447B74D